jgi:hypothetical protein
METKNIVTLIIVVVASALIIGLFIYFGGSNAKVDGGLRVVPVAADGTIDPLGARILRALASLESLKLDTSIFKDKAYTSLNDFSKDIKDEPIGRDNPFLPIGIAETPATPVTPPAPITPPINPAF